MIPVDFPQRNRVLEKPKGMTDEECSDLEIFTDGKVCVSCWQLNKEELELIQKTGKVYLVVVSGKTQPPVSLHVESPFVQ